ncbi:MAG TPA: hypothetical protein VFT91_07275 [Dehalococcoidia bacterium]|nr:hypothetical protein [Dehalococcoidia bacterium]
MSKKRTGGPWMPAGEYGRSLPGFSVNYDIKYRMGRDAEGQDRDE